MTERATAEPTADVAPAMPTASARILVADDNRGMREGCRDVLVAEGHQVDVAEDGLEGLARVGEVDYDLLIVDVKMPKVDGLELLRRARERDPDVVCVVITGYATLELAVEATKLGAYDFVAKPFTPRELMAVTNKALAFRRLSLETRRLRDERARNLLEIATEKSRLRTIVNCLQDGLLVMNRDGRIALVNPAAQRMLARSDAGLLGQAYSDAVPDPDLRDSIASTLAGLSEPSTTLSREVTLAGDGELTVLANVAPIVEPSGDATDVLGAVVVLHDISRLKELERIKEQFVRMVAHELRAPVAAIVQSLDAVLTGATASDRERERRMLGRCQQRAMELGNLVDDLLRMSAIDAGRRARKIELLDLSRLVTDTIELFRPQADARRIELRVKLPEATLAAPGDRQDLALILTNLISNAVKYNRDGGWIEVSASARDDGVAVEVKDGGFGIPEQQQAGLFREFFRAKTPETSRITGTGLGLSIVKRLVQAHNGRVWASSKYGQGSTFGFWLPETARP